MVFLTSTLAIIDDANNLLLRLSQNRLGTTGMYVLESTVQQEFHDAKMQILWNDFPTIALTCGTCGRHPNGPKDAMPFMKEATSPNMYANIADEVPLRPAVCTAPENTPTGHIREDIALHCNFIPS